MGLKEYAPTQFDIRLDSRTVAIVGTLMVDIHRGKNSPGPAAWETLKTTLEQLGFKVVRHL